MQRSYGGKLEQVRFAIIILILMLKKNLAQAIAHQQIMPNLKVRKKIYAPKNCPNPPQKNYGLSLKSILRDTCTSLARFAKLSF